MLKRVPFSSPGEDFELLMFERGLRGRRRHFPGVAPAMPIVFAEDDCGDQADQHILTMRRVFR